MIRTYSELNRIQDFYDRFKYLRLNGQVGDVTFGWERYLNQELYRSRKWKKVRDQVIIRDNGCDLSHPDFEIHSKIIIHHMNPITVDQIERDDNCLYDPELLICVSPMTHNAIHYGDERLLPRLPVERRPYDTSPWRW